MRYLRKFWIWVIVCLILATTVFIFAPKFYPPNNQKIKSGTTFLPSAKDSTRSKTKKDSLSYLKNKPVATTINILCTDFKSASNADGLKLQDIERDLLKCYRRIYEWEFKSYSDNQYDSIEKANADFRKKLQYYTSTFPQTLSYDFNLLKSDTQVEALNIATSPDGKFRIYSWDIGRGGSMRYYDNIIQYQSDKLCSKCVNADYDGDTDNGEYYSQIFEVHSDLESGSKSYYVGLLNKIAFGSDHYQGVNFFYVDRNGLIDSIELLKNKDNFEYINGTEYDPTSLSQSQYQDDKVILFENSGKTIKIPIVNSKRQLTKRYRTYKFDGKYFVKSKN